MSPQNNSALKGLISVNKTIHYTMETKLPKQILLPGFSNEENKQKIPLVAIWWPWSRLLSCRENLCVASSQCWQFYGVDVCRFIDDVLWYRRFCWMKVIYGLLIGLPSADCDLHLAVLGYKIIEKYLAAVFCFVLSGNIITVVKPQI